MVGKIKQQGIKIGILTAFLFAASVGVSTPTYAATNATCFQFDSATGTITNYYDTEGDVPGATACPKDVAIPSSIDSTSVIAVGEGAFAWKSLTSVEIPSSITRIDNNAFSNNDLTVVTIPGSVITIGKEAFSWNKISSLTLNEGLQTIGAQAFQLNQLHSVTLPSTLTSPLSEPVDPNSEVPIVTRGVFGAQGDAIGELAMNIPMRSYLVLGSLSDYDPELRAMINTAINEAWFVAIYTKDPANPRGYTDDVDIATFQEYETNIVTGKAVMGGYLINPTTTTIAYVNSQGATLQPSVVATGQVGSTLLYGYKTSSLTSALKFPYPTNANSPTIAEQQAIQTALAAYWRVDQTQTIATPAVAGYNNTPCIFTLGNSSQSRVYLNIT